MARQIPDRWRNCLNIECKKLFNPINPNAQCCSEPCRNRVGYLRRKKNVQVCDLPKQEQTNLQIIESLGLTNLTEISEDQLIARGFNFNNLPDAIKFGVDSSPSAFPFGDFLLIATENQQFKINRYERK